MVPVLNETNQELASTSQQSNFETENNQNNNQTHPDPPLYVLPKRLFDSNEDLNKILENW